MTICKKCGTKNSDDEIFCTNCGDNLMKKEYFEDTATVVIPKETVKETVDKEVEETPVVVASPKLPDDDNPQPKEKKASPRMVVIVIAVVAIVIGLVVGGILLFNNNKATNSKPDKARIIKDLSAMSQVTDYKVNNRSYTFEIKDAKISNQSSDDTKNTYSCVAKLTRENDVYGIKAVNYKVVYTQKDNEYKLTSAEAETDKVVLYAVAGIEESIATAKMQKSYPSAKVDIRKTNLEKGIDKIRYTIKDDDMQGTATILFKFNETRGWLFKGINDSKVEFKNAPTKKVKGLYTNANIKNILFMGVDSDSGVGRSDCMMLISIDSNTGTIKQTSFMRDNYFDIPGNGKNKLNAAYAFGKESLTIKTIENTFGIDIDSYVTVSFATFKDVINALGGVNVKITSDEAGYINWQIKKNGQESKIGLVSTSGGVTHMNGQQTLWLCRDRGGNGFSGNDFTRASRQRRVIRSLVNTYKTLSPAKVLATIKTLRSKVKTNITGTEFKWYAQHSVKFFSYKFKERNVPGDYEWEAGYTDGGAWIIKLNDFDRLKKDIQQFIYEDLKK